MISASVIAKRAISLAICTASCLLIGCGKKNTAQNSPAVQSNSEPTAANAPPVPANPSTPPPAAPASPDAVVTARSIDYLKGQINRKNWEQARLALQGLEGRTLTPAQKQYVDSLKSQIPPGK